MADVSEAEQQVLEALAALEADGVVQSVQRVAIRTGLDFTRAYNAINTLFGQGLIRGNLRVTDAGRELVA